MSAVDPTPRTPRVDAQDLPGVSAGTDQSTAVQAVHGDSGGSETGGGHSVERDALALAAILDPEAFTDGVLRGWDRAARQSTAYAHAERALAAGFRRVAEDPQGDEITITYRNYRGDVADRRIRPLRVWFGATEWHPQPQWLLDAIDAEKGERSFALRDVIDFGSAALRGGEQQ